MNNLSIQTKKVRFPTAPDLYGLFFEDISRSGDGGLYPELLRNRSFEDSISPARCTVSEDRTQFTTPLGWTDQFNNGEGMSKWMKDTPPTPIPAWYTEKAKMELDAEDTLNPNRAAALNVDFQAGGTLCNIGFHGVPYQKGDTYLFYMFAKVADTAATVRVAIVSKNGTVQDQNVLTILPGDYQRYDCTFTAVADTSAGSLCILSEGACSLTIGFTSLMPANTYKGHGMRKDLMELLDGINAHFLRFPGGCIVEGFTRETAMRFSNTIGPVWERPSHLLMWHYRTTNGLGFHEYLQICEDLGLEPMYVVNCGMTCQGRAMELFEGEEIQAFLQEAFDAIEYAIGDATTPMGKKRAEVGHPAPFSMRYIEIGNENHGEAYNKRYKMFYDALRAKYPQLSYISNSHTEKLDLPTEIADEHFYNISYFFMENVHYYDDYDRNGPDIFVGEYAVNEGTDSGALHSALAEAMFLLGIEHNQDIVKLTAYAPLFENVNFNSWFPNLIRFDNHRSLGIPSYYVQSLLGKNRGKDVVTCALETTSIYRDISGLPGIVSAKGGMQFKDATLNGNPVSISNYMQGDTIQNGNVFTTREDPGVEKFHAVEIPELAKLHTRTGLTFGDTPVRTGTFEIKIKADADNPVSIALWCYRPESYFSLNETIGGQFNLRSVRQCIWQVDAENSSVYEPRNIHKTPLGKTVPISIDFSVYNTYKVVMREDGFDCYLNDKFIQSAALPQHSALSSAVTTNDETIYIKLVNITDKDEAVNIDLDCPVAPEYELDLLTNKPDAMNSLDNPIAVSPVVGRKMNGASSSFTYTAPAYSLSVLRLLRQ